MSLFDQLGKQVGQQIGQAAKGQLETAIKGLTREAVDHYVQLRGEREHTIALLRQACREAGVDATWPDSQYLDVLERIVSKLRRSPR